MPAEWMKTVEPMVHASRIKVPYNWSVGETGSRFLTTLRDHKVLLGKRCESCQTVFVPPRKMCPSCFVDTGGWVQVGPQGILKTFTVVRYANGLQPLESPFAYGIVQPDGASTGLIHVLGEADLDNLRSGIRVEPVFADERSGSILDIRYFRPVAS